jgi:hypothetical protein
MQNPILRAIDLSTHAQIYRTLKKYQIVTRRGYILCKCVSLRACISPFLRSKIGLTAIVLLGAELE